MPTETERANILRLLRAGDAKNFELGIQLALAMGWDVAKELRFQKWARLEVRPRDLFARIELTMAADRWLAFCKLLRETGQYVRAISLHLLSMPSDRLSVRTCAELETLHILGARVDARDFPVSLHTLTLENADVKTEDLEHMARLTNLRELHLPNNRGIECVTKSLMRLPHLQALTLTGCRVDGFEELAAGDWQELKELDLSKNPLRALPDALGKLPKLTEFYVDWLNLSEIPAYAVRFGVRKLHGHRHLPKGLEYLPKGVTDMSCDFSKGERKETNLDKLLQQKDLQYISICHANIRKLPAAIGNHERLECLILRSNQIEVLPAQISKLKQLKEVDFSENKLTKIDVRIDTNVLCLDKNPINELSGDFCRSYIYKLSICHTYLEQLPDEMGKMSMLRYLYLSDNRLQKLPDSWELSSLQELNIAGNPIKYLPTAQLGASPFLHSLNMAGCSLKKIAASGQVAKIPDLFSLNLTKNPTLGEQATLSGRLVGRNLTSLSLADCDLQGLEEDFFEELPRLSSLDLSGNKRLRRLPASLWALSELRSLDLRGCDVETLFAGKEWENFIRRERRLLVVNLYDKELSPSFAQYLSSAAPRWLTIR